MRLVIIVAFASSFICIGAAAASAQTWSPPADSQRCPSKWGAGDQRGSNRRVSNEEIVLAEIGQVGTQFDTFAHQTIGDSLYNCFKLDDIATRNGFSKLGIENIGGLMTRGVLLDIAALKGVEMLSDTYEITVADLQQALQRQQRIRLRWW